ncbi:hypothetical protein HHK36_025688 [Tetracentron sinense]|uniref:Retrotransposon gag domain-containing protein n=1 Tax=Tetracentron sinense TaxID=13715 RepID=A0A834YLT1_TETSI|nr:hypothetical protein HHK36_025688 [Tetracentron sinense]
MVDNKTTEMGEDLPRVLGEILQKLTALENKQTSTEGKLDQLANIVHKEKGEAYEGRSFHRGEGVESSHSWSAGTIQSRTLKLNFPTFAYGDPSGWIYRAEQFFCLSPNNPGGKINHCLFPFARFGPTKYDDHVGALTKLRQNSTLREYQAEFEKLANSNRRIIRDVPYQLFHLRYKG